MSLGPGSQDDAEAFQRFYDDAAGALMGYLEKVAGIDAAPDLFQETWLRFLASDGPADPLRRRSYLFATATNLMRQRWRDLQRQRNRLALETGPEPAEVPADVDPRFTHALRQLDPRDRSLLWLAHVEEQSHAEIARSWDLATASVKVLLFRARHRLRTLLADMEVTRA